MDAVKKLLDKVLSWFCVVLFAALVLDVAWQVFARQVLNSPSGWSEELAKYLFIWLGLFGSALVFGERGHIAIEFVLEKLPGRAQWMVGIFVQLVILTFAALVLVYGGWLVSDLAWDQALAGLPLNVGPLYLALPISGLLVCFYTIYHLARIISGAESAVEESAPDVV